MKRTLSVILSLLILSCQTKEDATPANEGTFIRFHGTTDNNHAVLALESADGGYALLSNSTTEGTNAVRIKFTKTDLNGNLLWDSTYAKTGVDWRAMSFLDMTSDTLVNRGYLIVGDEINGTTTALLLLKVNPDGEMEKMGSISFTDAGVTYPLHGRAVTLDAEEHFIVLGGIDGHASKNIFVAKVDKDDMSVVWTRTYSNADAGAPMARIFRDSKSQDIWWGTPFIDDASQTSAVRLIHTAQDAENPKDGALLGTYDFDETPEDFCPMTGGWAITGTTNEKGNDDILVLRVDYASNVMFSMVLENAGDDHGVSIARTGGNAFVVLGTVSTTDRRNDLTIAKIGPTGAVEWQFNYGGADDQEAASIRETSDGSYLVFGTTFFVNEEKLMLMKVNKDGKLY